MIYTYILYKINFFLGGGGNAHDCYTKQKSEIFSHYRELHLAQEITYKNSKLLTLTLCRKSTKIFET